MCSFDCLSCQNEKLEFTDVPRASSSTRYTSSYTFDLSAGFSEGKLMQAILNQDDKIQLGDSLVMNENSITGMKSGLYVRDIAYDSVNNLLYMGGLNDLQVLDTKGTADFSDDEVIATYNSSSTPAMNFQGIYDVDYDATSGTVLISTRNGGVFWLDVKGNADPSDDVLIHNYTSSSTPALHGSNYSLNSTLGSNGLLVTTAWGQGVTLWDTNGTINDVTDDIEVNTMKNGTTPAIPSRWVGDAYYDEASGMIFVGNGGVQYIDTNMTPFDASDDVNLGSLSSSTTPAILCDRTHEIEYDSASGLLFAACDNWQAGTTSGITIIDTKKTNSPADDTIFAIYDDTNDFDYSGTARLHQMRYDHSTTTLYFPFRYSYYEDGFVKINLKGTPTKADDEITIYKAGDELIDGNVMAVEIIPELNAIFVGSSNGIVAFRDNYQHLSGSYVLDPLSTQLWKNNEIMSWDATVPSGTSISVDVRTGSVEYEEDFSDNDVTNITDFYSWGSIVPTITESNGVLTLTGTPGATSWFAFWFDTGEADDYFPSGSFIEARLKVTTSASNYQDCIFVDNWESDSTCFDDADGEWQTISLITNSAFSKIGFEPWYTDSTWAASDKIEIDYIKVVPPANWTAWKSVSQSELDNATYNKNDDYFQVKLNLESDSLGKTPTLNAVYLKEPVN